jgi:hypothetical protein
MFDEKTIQQLKFYVYILVDPVSKLPFYVGKGKANRVFAHLAGALKEDGESLKYEKIREINKQGLKPEHLIVRHGLSEGVAFELEASLIDVLQFMNMKYKKTNIAGGHNSVEKGLMTSGEITRLYNAQKLDGLDDGCIIININKTYKRGSGTDDIYEATKEAWVIAKKRLGEIKYVLSEYKGLIVEVFKVKEWYPVKVPYTAGSKKTLRKRIRYGFKKAQPPQKIREKYLNKSIAHHKRRGQVSPIRFHL